MAVQSNPSESQPTRVELGYVVGAHALKGELRVRWLGDGPDNLLSAEGLWLGESPSDSNALFYTVRGVGSGRHGEVRVKLQGVDDRTAAEGLRGRAVLVDADQLAPLAEGEFYWHELIGFQVETLEGQRSVRLSKSGIRALMTFWWCRPTLALGSSFPQQERS